MKPWAESTSRRGGAAENSEPADRAPLHRWTLERDDPAAAWLSFTDRVKAELWGGIPQVISFGVLSVLPMAWAIQYMQHHGVVLAGRRVVTNPWPAQLAGIFGLAGAWITFAAVRWARAQVKAWAVRSLARGRALAQAVPSDDWSALAGQPDGHLVSVVGWVRGRRLLRHRIDGQTCVGVALDCRGNVTEFRNDNNESWRARRVAYRQPHELIMEVLHDFDLVDEAGRSLAILAADARLLGKKNTDKVGDDTEEQRFLNALDLPLDLVPCGDDTFVLRDGDPVLVVGFKTTTFDPDEISRRNPTPRTALASSPPRPLLIFPIAAERRWAA